MLKTFLSLKKDKAPPRRFTKPLTKNPTKLSNNKTTDPTKLEDTLEPNCITPTNKLSLRKEYYLKKIFPLLKKAAQKDRNKCLSIKDRQKIIRLPLDIIIK
jgi:hypothetical protein